MPSEWKADFYQAKKAETYILGRQPGNELVLESEFRPPGRIGAIALQRLADSNLPSSCCGIGAGWPNVRQRCATAPPEYPKSHRLVYRYDY